MFIATNGTMYYEMTAIVSLRRCSHYCVIMSSFSFNPKRSVAIYKAALILFRFLGLLFHRFAGVILCCWLYSCSCHRVSRRKLGNSCFEIPQRVLCQNSLNSNRAVGANYLINEKAFITGLGKAQKCFILQGPVVRSPFSLNGG